MRTAVSCAITLMMGLLIGVGTAFAQQEGHLQPGSDPSVLPGPILIAAIQGAWYSELDLKIWRRPTHCSWNTRRPWERLDVVSPACA